MELVQFTVRSDEIAIGCCCDVLYNAKLLRPNCLTDCDKTISCRPVGSESGVGQFGCSVALVPLSPQVLN
jgi:hypothetical protein